MSTMTVDKAAPTRPVKYGSMSRDRVWALRWSYFFLTLFAIFSLLPPLYMLITSLKSSAEISAATNPWWVFHPTLANYIGLLTSNQFLRFFWNSAWVSIFVVTITMLISVPAAFALARMRFWGSATLATGVLLTYLIPDTLLFIPLFKMFVVFGDWTGIQLINRWYVLLLIYPTLTVPFCTWIMIGYFASIPKELDEAAIIDGASWFQTLTRIFIPVALPGLIAATIFAFTVSWAQFLYPLVFTTSTDQLVLPVGIITTLIGGDVVNDVPPKDRDIAMVFQNYALYPHMTVAENMSFGLRLKRFPKAEIKMRVDEAARMLDIAELVDRKPKQLSGGQRQRVAMGRAIVRHPKVFLFDEPLSNLDAKLRVQMRIEIKKVHQQVRTTTVYVNNVQDEAMTLADRVVVMNHGIIEQVGP